MCFEKAYKMNLLCIYAIELFKKLSKYVGRFFDWWREAWRYSQGQWIQSQALEAQSQISAWLPEWSGESQSAAYCRHSIECCMQGIILSSVLLCWSALKRQHMEKRHRCRCFCHSNYLLVSFDDAIGNCPLVVQSTVAWAWKLAFLGYVMTHVICSVCNILTQLWESPTTNTRVVIFSRWKALHHNNSGWDS